MSHKNYKKSKKINLSLFSSGKNKPKTKTGYGNKSRAIMTLKNIKKYNKIYQKQVVNTLYNRAKYHKYQNKDMREAMKVFKLWLKNNN